ncbi:hypothetical protein [Actinophytocola sediminis]
MTEDPWRRLRRRVAECVALVGLLFSAYVITRSSTLVGVVVGVPLAAAAGFAVGSLVAKVKRYAVERIWIALGLLVFAIGAGILFDVLDG